MNSPLSKSSQEPFSTPVVKVGMHHFMPRVVKVGMHHFMPGSRFMANSKTRISYCTPHVFEGYRGDEGKDVGLEVSDKYFKAHE